LVNNFFIVNYLSWLLFSVVSFYIKESPCL
jgi:hypothetical protein